jgi:hypothetical protein
MSPICPPPWHFTTWLDLDLLDHWQTLIAGGLALLAAIIAALIAVISARRKERREIKAIRLSLTEEIWWLLRHLLEVHKGLRELSVLSSGWAAGWPASAVRDYASLREAVVYPAIADKIGFTGKLAPYVVAFYGNIEHLRSHVRTATADPAQTLTSMKLDEIAEQFEQACQENALPLLNQLPKHQGFTEVKERIEAMGRTPAPTTCPLCGQVVGGGG